MEACKDFSQKSSKPRLRFQITVPTYQEVKGIKRCVGHIKKQTTKLYLEICEKPWKYHGILSFQKSGNSEFEEATEQIDMKKLLQVSMDGPSVNWKLLDSIAEDRSSNEQYPILLNVGSCSLHVVHGPFRNGIKQTNWGIVLLLRSLHSLFNETPAGRDDYTKITGSGVFPQQFCGHRWLEDKEVAERTLEIWPNLTAFVT